MTPKEIIEKKIKERMAEKPNEKMSVKAKVVLNITGPKGGIWTLDTTSGALKIKEGAVSEPDVKVSMADEDLVALYNKKISPIEFFFSGRIKVEGDSMILMKLKGIF